MAAFPEIQYNYTNINLMLKEIETAPESIDRNHEISQKCDEIFKNLEQLKFEHVPYVDYALAKKLKNNAQINPETLKKIKNVYRLQIEKKIMNKLAKASVIEPVSHQIDFLLSEVTDQNLKQQIIKSVKKELESSQLESVDSSSSTVGRLQVSTSGNSVGHQIKVHAKQGVELENTLDTKQENEIIHSLRIERNKRLIELINHISQKKAPESVSMKRKCFPNTCAIYMGSFRQDKQKIIEEEMLSFSQRLGLILVTDSKSLKTEYNLLLLRYSELNAPFSQDFIECSENSFHICYVPEEVDTQSEIMIRTQNTAIIEEAREKREPLYIKYRGTYFAQTVRTTLPAQPYYRKTIQLACALNVPLQMQFTCAEGGNLLSGERKGKPCIIVGMDTVEINRYYLKKNIEQLKEGANLPDFELDDEIMKIIFGADYGVDPKNVIFIEQPGDYHLDMSMTFVRDNTILLNNSSQSDQKDDPVLKQFLTQKRKFEKKVKNTLRKADFKVISKPWIRYDSSHEEPRMVMNLFNCVLGVSERTGEKFVFSLGCPEAYQKKLKKFFKGATVFFLNEEASKACLYPLAGGISCATKTLA